MPRANRGLLLVVALVLSPRAALAAAPSDASVAAEALFTAGRADVERGDYASACPKFADSQRLDPAPGTLINLADCEEHVGQLARAWQHWREALERLPETDPRRSVVALRTAAIDQRVPRLTVTISGAAPHDVSIRRDDLELPTSLVGVPVPLDPGRHAITLEAKGHLPARVDVDLAEGARESVVLAPGAPLPSAPVRADVPAAAPEPKVAANDDARAGADLRWLGYGLVGVGVLGIGTGTVTGLMAIDRKETQEENCFPSNVCNPAGADAAAEGGSLALASTIGFVAGAVAAAAGLYLLLRDHGGGRKASESVVRIGGGPFGLGTSFSP